MFHFLKSTSKFLLQRESYIMRGGSKHKNTTAIPKIRLLFEFYGQLWRTSFTNAKFYLPSPIKFNWSISLLLKLLTRIIIYPVSKLVQIYHCDVDFFEQFISWTNEKKYGKFLAQFHFLRFLNVFFKILTVGVSVEEMWHFSRQVSKFWWHLYFF